MALFSGDGGASLYADDVRHLSVLDQASRLELERRAKTYLNTTLEDLVGRIGYEAGIQSLAELENIRPDQGGGNPTDDLLRGTNADEINAMFAQADAKARAAEARARAEQQRNLRASLQREMRYGQFAVPFDVSKHINDVVKRNGNFDMLLNKVFADKRFKKMFPGIMDPKSKDIKMSVAEYMQRRDDARVEFGKAGLGLSDEQFGFLMSKNVSPNEAQARAQIGAFIKGNADLLLKIKGQVAEQNAARKAKGLPPLSGLNTMKDIADFVTRNKSPELYSTYEAGVVATAAQRAGISVSTKRARELAGAAPGIEDLAESEGKFKTIADRVRVAGVELGAVGLSQADLETIEFGGKNRSVLAQRAEQALVNRQAEIEAEPEAEALELRQGRPVATGPVRQAGL